MLEGTLRQPAKSRRKPLFFPRPRLPGLSLRNQDFGTVKRIGVSNTWDAATVSLSEPAANQFWLLEWGTDALGYMYNLGASQNAACRVDCQSHNGIGNFQMACGILRKSENAAWPGSFNIDTGSSSSRHCTAMLLESVGGFRGEVVKNYWVNVAATTTCATAPPSNPMLQPGGILYAAASMDGGGAGQNMATGTGWIVAQVAGLGTSAYYPLPLDRIITPPTPTFSSSRSDAWIVHYVYYR